GAIRPHVAGGGAALSVESARRLPESVTEPLEFLRREVGAREVRPLFVPMSVRGRAVSRASTRGGRSVSVRDRNRIAVIASVAESPTEELAGLTVVDVPEREISSEVLSSVSSSPGIDFAEVMPARWLSRTQPSQPAQNRQWCLRAINWYQSKVPDARNVVVSVLDTGVDPNHPDLKALTINYDHNGLSSRDIIGHGTHVSGIISATTNNAVGINGVARCKLAM